MGYVFGVLIIVVGAFMVIKTRWFIENFGHSAWAEEKLGGGGTVTIYKVLGILVIIGSLMSMTGLMGKVLINIFGRAFGI